MKHWWLSVSGGLAVIAVAVTIIGSTVGSSTLVPGGPLGKGRLATAEQCVPGKSVGVGDDVLTAPAGSDVRLIHASLYKAHGLRLKALYMVRIVSHRKGGTALGTVTFPPKPSSIPSDLYWAHRIVPGDGEVLVPGAPYNVVVALTRTAKIGYTLAFQFTYSSGGTTYLWRSGLQIKVVPRVCS